MVKITSKLMSHIMARRKKATILFATETGKSESFAKMLKSHFLQAFDVQMFCMDAYDFSKISQENLLLVVTSTFGNGEAPMNGEVIMHLTSSHALHDGIIYSLAMHVY